jgi:hypothetical protein
VTGAVAVESEALLMYELVRLTSGRSTAAVGVVDGVEAFVRVVFHCSTFPTLMLLRLVPPFACIRLMASAGRFAGPLFPKNICKRGRETLHAYLLADVEGPEL